MIIANDSLLTQYANIIYYYKHHTMAMQLVIAIACSS